MKGASELIGAMDAIVDTYQGQDHPIHALITMRRELAGYLYCLTGFTKKTHGNAGLANVKRKYAFARAVINAKQMDAKLPFNIAEVNSEATDGVRELREQEVMAEAAKDALRDKIRATEQVLASMQQEIAVATHEMKTTHYQGSGSTVQVVR